MQSPEIGKLAEALSKAQSEITGAVKGTENPYFKSQYADLGAVWAAVRGPLTKNGLSVVQELDTRTLSSGELVREVITKLLHVSGQWISSHYPVLCAEPNKPQVFGSAVTYARRYSLAAIVCVPQVDDDGQMASDHRETQFRVSNGTTPTSIQVSSVSMISEAERKTLVGLVNEAGWSPHQAKEYMTRSFGVSGTSELTKDQYLQFYSDLQSQLPQAKVQ